MHTFFLYTLVVCLLWENSASETTVSLGVIDWPIAPNPFANGITFITTQLITARTIALNDVNNDVTIMPNITLSLDIAPVALSQSLSIDALIGFSESDKTFILGNPSSFSAVQTATVASVLDVAQLASLPTTPQLTSFPSFFRLTPPALSQVLSTKDTIVYYSTIQTGWKDVALLSTTDGFGVALASSFVEHSTPELNVISYRQYIAEETISEGLLGELQEIKKSGARVIVAFVFDSWDTVASAANQTEIIGENYVWFVPNTIISLRFGSEDVRSISRGVIGTIQSFPENEAAREFEERWLALDPTDYPVAGPNNPAASFTRVYYDMVVTAAKAIDILTKEGKLTLNSRISSQSWVDALKQIDYEGLSGRVVFDSNGDRPSAYDVLYYDPESDSWKQSGIWHDNSGYEHIDDVVWYSNITEVPDLDIRESFEYYSCHHREFRTDKTGKEVSLHTPNGSNIDDIDEEYYCDNFIDCKNMSDESFGCTSNFVAIFIVFGIFTGVLIMIAFVLITFVIIFGITLKYRRLRVASPFFLILILLSIILGFSSVFAWFGKPHPVACAFQPWILGLSTLSMIIGLCVKTFRIWRIFRFPMAKVKISDFELFALWFILMIPAIIIVALWTIISTPTAAVEEHDGKEHFVCTSGGFTGSPGGIVFFSLFAGYGALILLLGIIITIMSRNVPSQFNESKLVAISIYNLTLLSVVIIPVYMVVVEYNPFIAWIVRTCAVLYAFGATMFLQFLPKVLGIVILDKCQNKKVFVSTLKPSSGTNSKTGASSLLEQ